MTRARPAPAERIAFRQFADGVLAFSQDPGPTNLDRYLAGSWALEESRALADTSAGPPSNQTLDERRTHDEQPT
jgi:hypothetical protein